MSRVHAQLLPIFSFSRGRRCAAGSSKCVGWDSFIKPKKASGVRRMKTWQRGQPPNPRHPPATPLGRPDVTLSWNWLITFRLWEGQEHLAGIAHFEHPGLGVTI